MKFNKNMSLFSLCTSVLFTILVSCTKENIPKLKEDEPDSFYKERIEKLLHSTFIASKTQSTTKESDQDFSFKTYREAYDFFKFLENKKPVTHSDTAKEINYNLDTRANFTALPVRTSQSVNYTANCSGNTSISETFGLANIRLTYSVFFTVQYIPIYTNSWMFSVTSNRASGGIFFYGGVGTASGTPNISANAGSAGGGSIDGTLQGTATIAGTTISFYIIVAGNFSYSIPGTPGVGTPVVSTTLSATAP